jgi:hypothetical protein
MYFVLGVAPAVAGSSETSRETTDLTSTDSCACVEAKRTHGWCEACGVGYVGDVPIRSRYLWHVLDAHGHTLNIESLNCVHCTEAAATDGYCADSKIGFVDGKAYFSRLTWLLARADRQELERADYDALVHDLQILAIANKAAEHCEQCAAAIVTDTQCPVCRIRYQDGKPMRVTPSARE